MTSAQISPSGKVALRQLAVNEAAGRRTHRSAVHNSTRHALLGRGLVEWVPPLSAHHAQTYYLRLTVAGRLVAGELT